MGRDFAKKSKPFIELLKKNSKTFLHSMRQSRPSIRTTILSFRYRIPTVAHLRSDRGYDVSHCAWCPAESSGRVLCGNI